MNAELPHFSIVIPTYNRPEPLWRCLEALVELDYPVDRFEVIVVDDGGRHPLDGLAANFRDRLAIRMLHQDNAGPGAARNTGAARATGEYLAFTDDDCRPESGWLRAFATRYQSQPDALLGGRTLNGLPENLYSTASQDLQAWFYDYCEIRASPLRFFASNNLSLPAVLFHKIGGFDTATLRYAAEDRELCGRWLAWGGAMVYVPRARVWHYHRLNLSSFIRQHFAYGRGAFRLRLGRRRQGLPPLPGDPRWMLASLTRYPFREAGLGRGLVLSTLVFCTHVANAIGYACERQHGVPARRR